MKEIHKSKLPANMVMVTDANGYPSASSLITASELNTLNNYDGKGYIFPRLSALETTVETKSFCPDWSKKIGISNPYTATSPGWVVLWSASNSTISFYINDIEICSVQGNPGHWVDSTSVQIMVSPGDVMSSSSGFSIRYFVPFMGA